MYVIHDVTDKKIEHHGIKGMHWGVRKDFNVSEDTARKIKFGARVAAGVATAGIILAATHNAPQTEAGLSFLNNDFSYRVGQGPWLTTLPRTSLAEATRGLK